LTGGSVGFFEGKKIGRAKILKSCRKKFSSQNAVVELLKENTGKTWRVIAFNEDLRENALKNTN
jgi:hypothetical protein